ncbi:Flp family type IVb pilin [Planctomicrobium sp. SH664]|uniref:Flp family type IVb pilin n=1 Tax=Planctomicrobium sp. SH664 TaxID=3448125 RepID=UPI003F5B9611
MRSLQSFLRDEDGPTAVEYAVMIGLIITVCVTAIQLVGTKTNALFNRVDAEIQSAES